jgi:methylaspartate ammonia-lyase
MNDLSVFDGDQERERQICDLRVRGKTEVEVCEMLGVTVADIHRALDRAAQASMTAAARVRDIFLDKSRLEVYEQSLVPAAIGGDVQAIATAVRVQERKHTLTGANAPMRVDPIQLAQEAASQLTSTDQLKAVFDEWRAEMAPKAAREKADGE